MRVVLFPRNEISFISLKKEEKTSTMVTNLHRQSRSSCITLYDSKSTKGAAEASGFIIFFLSLCMISQWICGCHTFLQLRLCCVMTCDLSAGIE